MAFSQSAMLLDLCFLFVILHLLISAFRQFHHLLLVVLLVNFSADYVKYLT